MFSILSCELFSVSVQVSIRSIVKVSVEQPRVYENIDKRQQKNLVGFFFTQGQGQERNKVFATTHQKLMPNFTVRQLLGVFSVFPH